jgi:hypothetical protein
MVWKVDGVGGKPLLAYLSLSGGGGKRELAVRPIGERREPPVDPTLPFALPPRSLGPVPIPGVLAADWLAVP